MKKIDGVIISPRQHRRTNGNRPSPSNEAAYVFINNHHQKESYAAVKQR
ncbi:MAG TPA: hypothetical protein VEL11_11735 [Candidatus Bathyarchaeia archaeon]|nr:hypothetical protein [Candidatus Bathyarchaeia archaeon]